MAEDQKTLDKQFYKAITNGDLDQAKDLITKGADVNHKSPLLSYTPLMKAVMSGKMNVVQYLLTIEGINLNLSDGDGYNVLHKAVSSKIDMEIVKCLVGAGIDIEAKTKAGKTALHLASSNDNSLFVEYVQKIFVEGQLKLDKKIDIQTGAETGYIKIDDDTVERVQDLKSGKSLSVVFNFSARTVDKVFESKSGVTMNCKGFDTAVSREEIDEAYEELKLLKGNPPHPWTGKVEKKHKAPISAPFSTKN